MSVYLEAQGKKNIVYSIDVSLYFVTYNLSLYVIS